MTIASSGPISPTWRGIHALIEQRDGHAYLRDFGAEGGTGLNDRVSALASEAEVFDGDLDPGRADGPDPGDQGEGRRAEGIRPSDTASPRPTPTPTSPTAGPFSAASHRRRGRLGRRASRPSLIPVLSPRPSADPGPARTVRRSVGRRPRLAVLDPPQVAAAHAHHAHSPVAAPVRGPHGRRSPSWSAPVISHLRALDCEMVDGVLVVKIIPPELSEEETVSPVRYELRGRSWKIVHRPAGW